MNAHASQISAWNPDLELLHRLIFTNTVGCVKILDLDGALLSMNEGGQRALEINNFEKLKGSAWASLWPTEARIRVNESIALARAGQHAKFVGLCPTAKGTPKWWAVDVTPLRNEAGHFNALLAVSHDISELQNARFKLQETNLRRDLLMAAGKIGEWSLDLATGVATCSAFHDQCFGFEDPVCNWTFDRFLNCVHPDDRSGVAARIQNAIEKQEVLRDEYRVIWPDGVVHWIASVGTVFIEEGKSRRWFGVVHNITERKRAEAIDRGKKLAFERMVEGDTLANILDSLCIAAEEHFGGIVFSCILLADSGNEMLHHLTSPSLPDAFRFTLQGMSISEDSGACGRAAYLRQSVYVDDIARSSLSQDLKNLAGDCGIISCWTTPIISTGNNVLGTFALYYKTRQRAVDKDRAAVAEIVSTIAIIIDRFQHVEEKNRIEKEFHAAQTQLEATLRAVEVATWSYDIKNAKLHSDVNLQKMLSLTPSETQDGSLSSFLRPIHPEDYHKIEALIRNAIETGLPYETKYRVLSMDGNYHTVLARGHIEYDAKNDSSKLSGVLLDITRQQEAEDKLEISRERYSQLFRMMDQGLCIIEVLYDENDQPIDCRYIETNPAFEEYTGLYNVAGKTFRSQVPEIEDFWISTYAKVAQTGESIRFEHESKAMGRWFDVYASRVDERNALVSVLFTDITARKAHEKLVLDYNRKLDREANFDSLTGLPNRRLFRDRLAQEILARERDRKSVYLLFLDLDNFKEVNDFLGHSAGDEVLKEIADRLRSCVRIDDTVARLGGDEFTIILVGAHDSHVEQIAQKILDRVNEVFYINSKQLRISCSIGITIYPDDGKCPDDLIRNADQAMYRSKNGGKNQLTFFEYAMHVEAMQRLKTISELRAALARKEILLYFQPIIDLETGRITKAEALVRWQHPLYGILLPGKFIGLAEETGLIDDIGDWVLKETLSCLKRWKREHKIDLQISINESPKQFLKKGHTIEWLEWIKDSGLPESSIVVEITESVLVDDNEIVSDNLCQLHQCGMKLSIDDFGTGYSSLAYLKNLNANFLKLDQSFIKNLITDPTDTIIVETIITMGHKLGLKIIAEGVENPKQLDWLKSNNCDFVQGFLISEALSIENFEKLIETVPKG
jgi:diguanylate cyclase (GGDEF)-like protein/PAS domain S-box-containing protein